MPFGPGDFMTLDNGEADTRDTAVPHTISQFCPFVPMWLTVLSDEVQLTVFSKRHDSAHNPLNPSTHIGIIAGLDLD